MHREGVQNIDSAERLVQTPSALFFPGQGLNRDEVVASLHRLEEASPRFLMNGFRIAQEVFDEMNPNKKVDLRTVLLDADSICYSDTGVFQPIDYVLSVLEHSVSGVGENMLPYAPASVGGHSVGEYAAAATAARVIDFESGLRLVTKRGQVMQRAGERYPSRLMIVTNLDADTVRDECAKTHGHAYLALINTSNATVVGVLNESADAVAQQLKTRGARKIIPVQSAAAAFHTPFMAEAAEEWAQFVEDEGIEFRDVPDAIAFYMNATGQRVRTGAEVKNILKRAFTETVLFPDVVGGAMRHAAVAIALGPSSTLTALIKGNNVPPESIKDFSAIRLPAAA